MPTRALWRSRERSQKSAGTSAGCETPAGRQKHTAAAIRNPPPSLARENEQLCIVMFLAIRLFLIFCYIIFRLKKQRSYFVVQKNDQKLLTWW